MRQWRRGVWAGALAGTHVLSAVDGVPPSALPPSGTELRAAWLILPGAAGTMSGVRSP